MARAARAMLCLLTLATASAAPTTLPQTAGISGTITIDAGPVPTTTPSTRPATQPAARPAAEQYTLALNVVGTTEYTGRVVRRPDGRLVYDVAVAVVSPKDLVRKKQVGRWTGEVAGGGYDWSGLKLSVDAPDKDGKPVRYADAFAGRATTKPAGAVTYARKVDGRTALWSVDAVKRLHLTDGVLAMGPVPLYPQTTVGGHLDVTGGGVFVDIGLAATGDTKPARDTVTGSVRRIEDAGRVRYDVDLRFNDPPAAPAKPARGHDEAFFTPDPSVPGLRGAIDVTTEDGPGGRRTRLTVRLTADGLSKPQVVAAFKLALLCLGPLRDIERP